MSPPCMVAVNFPTNIRVVVSERSAYQCQLSSNISIVFPGNPFWSAMGDDGAVYAARGNHSRQGAGIIHKIHMENFMCHSSLEIQFGERVNFITGQNGSGKSAILTALCVAFGCRAKGTQRASTLKDFIKTGCSYALVQVELKNRSEDAFKPDFYGDTIIIERRITESSSSTILKDCQGKKVTQKKDELHELVEHFNIDVENPCVIMGQDKSREFLHSGNDKEKFKFFFKATLLQQVHDLLQNIRGQLNTANVMVDELESSIRPTMKELKELEAKIKNMEYVKELSERVQELKKKLAWSWVYDVDRQIEEQGARLEKLESRVPICQANIDREVSKVGALNVKLLEKKNEVASITGKTSEVTRMKEELQRNFSLARKEKLELEGEYTRTTNLLNKLLARVKLLEQQVDDIQAQHTRSTQVEESMIEEELKRCKEEVDMANESLASLKEDEIKSSEKLSAMMAAIDKITEEMRENEKKCHDIHSHISELQRHTANKVTAFGGERVINLLRTIEMYHEKFSRPPIGPIGAHITLVNDDTWALAVEIAIGKLLNGFIVTSHKDFILLRECAKSSNYHNLQIFIYDFSRPRLDIPSHMLPKTEHPTIFSVIQSNNPTVLNVLVDMGSAERQVLVRDYKAATCVAFDQKIPNLKEVYTLDGCKMFSRGSVQTVLPPNKKIRNGRLCSSFEGQINSLQMDASAVIELLQQSQSRKRNAEESYRALHLHHQNVKKRRLNVERELRSKDLALNDLKHSYASVASDVAPNVDDHQQEITKFKDEICEKQILLEALQTKMFDADVKAKDFKLSLENLCDSAKGEIEALEEAECELTQIEEELRAAEDGKTHYEGVMQKKVLADIKAAQSQYADLQCMRKENFKKASIICPESEIEAMGGCSGKSPEQLSAQLNRLMLRLQEEAPRKTESIEDLKMMHEKKERRIRKKKQTFDVLHEKLNACQKALDLRWSKFQRNATLLKRQLTWQFNGHLRKKGITGHIKVSYDQKTLQVEVKMPQDVSNKTVRDTRGLSGGERSFSTLCFALALHEMTEAPFRAMDEFDVFMDAVSRKISLDTLVDFAVAQGSQWIFITPHDISMVKSNDKIRKQQMPAPRSEGTR